MNFQEFLGQYQKVPVEHYAHQVPGKQIISVCVQTYQHVNFIRECLDSILMQETNFPFEILLGDDASTDGTREICIEYAQRYPDKIRLFLHDRKNNIAINGSPTGRFNIIYNLFSARGKYIALCEGDDYWTDPKKLQKQVDFLEENEGFNICFTRANLLKNKKFELHPVPEKNGLIYTYENLLEHYNFIVTASVLFRNTIDEIPDWFVQLPYADLGLYLLVSKHKKIKCLKDVSTVYRIHKNGAWSGKNIKKKLEMQLSFYQIIYSQLTSAQKKIVKNKHQSSIKKLASHLYSNWLLRKFKEIQLRKRYKLLGTK
jgi:glycosyltransferase involved in cell wall biosynthesis